MDGLVEVAVRTLVVYMFLVLGLRLAGKREIGQMTTFDLVVILVLANAVQNAMVGADTSLAAGLVAAATLLAANHLMSWLRARFGAIGHWLDPVPTLIIEDGELLTENIRREFLGEDEIRMALREHGVEDPALVHKAYLESDGTISVIPRQGAKIRRPKPKVRILKKG